jgi:hypothetical protein
MGMFHYRIDVNSQEGRLVTRHIQYMGERHLNEAEVTSTNVDSD